ncbi:MAG: hypothetical protein FWE89_05205 [Syntrophaceae bacterium]|nr:hypothetical protein [Syntrophaceae bacterium]
MKDNAERRLQEWLQEGTFRFARFELPGIDNEPVVQAFGLQVLAEEMCLFHHGVKDGFGYLERLHDYVRFAMAKRRPAPVVRFADGEYAFYSLTLECNGLYRQAESLDAIRQAMPMHVEALRRLAGWGKIAPLIFPGNVIRRRRKGLLALLSHQKEPSALGFLAFLRETGIELSGENYVPFYAVYAYLTSEAFAHLVDGKKVAVLTSDFNAEAFRSWFARFGSRPEILFAPLPGEYVATRWETIRETALAAASSADLCLVGAGVGALPVCVDVAERYSLPVLDAGHVLNMMNGREDKSKGPRMYTCRKAEGLRWPAGAIKDSTPPEIQENNGGWPVWREKKR